MSATYTQIPPYYLGTLPVSFYTAVKTGSNTFINGKITKLVLTNTHSSYVLVSIYIVPPGVGGSNNNVITIDRRLGAGQSWECDKAEGFVLGDGWSLQAKASIGGVVNMQGSVFETMG